MNKKFVFTLLILLFFAGNINAQDDIDCGLDAFEGDCQPLDAPIDNGVIFLIIAGVVLGLRALKKDDHLKEA